MTGGNVKKAYQSCVEFNIGILADWRRGLAEILWNKTKENAEPCTEEE